MKKWMSLVVFCSLVLFQNCASVSPQEQEPGPKLFPTTSPSTTSPSTTSPSTTETQAAALQKTPTKSCTLDFMDDTYQCVTIQYGSHELHTYDLWLPNQTSEEGLPVVVYIHGGGYKGGDKSSGLRESVGIQKYLEAGYAFATFNYRLSGDHPYTKGVTGDYPVQMLDSATALQDLRMRAKHYGLSREKVALIGSSAGGGISLWLGLHDDLRVKGSATPRERHSTRSKCIAIAGTQTTLNIQEVLDLFQGSPFKLDSGIPMLYGITNTEYLSNPAKYQKQLAASMYEASPISHLSPDDRGLKLLLTYARDFGVGNIHSPEFGRYIAKGEPTALASQYNRKSLDTIGIKYSLKTAQGPGADMVNIFDFVTKTCF